MAVISLLTDFGLRDGYVGVMKGVIWNINPYAQIADITHFIAPQDVRQGALALLRTTKYFPKGTVHVAVVDPGVGTARRPLGFESGGHYFVGPDNGLFWPLLEAADKRGEMWRCFVLDCPEYWLPNVSRVFHGRDIFAPAAAHLSLGVPLEKMGSLVGDPVRLQIPEPVRTPTGWQGEVIEVDNFGNLAVNLTREHIPESQKVTVKIAGRSISGLARTFGDRPAGELTAMFGTENDLMIAIVQGSAAALLGAKAGDPVEVNYLEHTT